MRGRARTFRPCTRNRAASPLRKQGEQQRLLPATQPPRGHFPVRSFGIPASLGVEAVKNGFHGLKTDGAPWGVTEPVAGWKGSARGQLAGTALLPIPIPRDQDADLIEKVQGHRQIGRASCRER